MTDVIVVGAGPTGLTLACGLQAAGVDVRVLDKASGPAVTSRALGLQPRGVEVLDRLGALGDLPDRGLPIRTVTINVDGRELASFPVGQATRLGGPRGLIMSQADIEAALRDRLIALGGDVEWGRGVSGLEPERHGVRVRLDDGSDADASWVVAADGAHSVVRKAMGIGFPGVPVVERFLLADVHADIDLQRGGATSWLRGDMMLAVFPLPGIDLWRVMAPAPTGFGDEPAAAAIVDYLGTRLAAEAGGTIRSVVWTSSFRIQRRLADSYRRARVLLAGDAAHIQSPFGGQGMNTGIGDAENLAWKLALVVSGRAGERLLDSYEAERRPIAKGVLGLDKRCYRGRSRSGTRLPAAERSHCRAADESRLAAESDHGKDIATSSFVPARPARGADCRGSCPECARRPRRRSDLHSLRRSDRAAIRRAGSGMGAARAGTVGGCRARAVGRRGGPARRARRAVGATRRPSGVARRRCCRIAGMARQCAR